MLKVLFVKKLLCEGFLKVLAAAVIATSFAAHRAEAITLTPSATEVTLGDTFTVSIEFESTDQIGGIAVGFGFEPLRVTAGGVSLGSVFDGLVSGLDFLAFPADTTASSYSQTILFAVDKSDASLLEFSFTAAAVGVANFTQIGQATNSLAPTDTFNASASTSVTIKADPNTMTPVPLPASALLLMAGLAGLIGMRRRR